ncbi:unnamed protein product [Trichogramma brassicae]|uniref:Uncharacterized protein n=1 Tax=Trichogramma brassicae TaxID=86971 RepID=A0A6H5J292_9HYME|nr:unnamed protein product [Trichogramma brassicae]
MRLSASNSNTPCLSRRGFVFHAICQLISSSSSSSSSSDSQSRSSDPPACVCTVENSNATSRSRCVEYLRSAICY